MLLYLDLAYAQWQQEGRLGGLTHNLKQVIRGGARRQSAES